MCVRAVTSVERRIFGAENARSADSGPLPALHERVVAAIRTPRADSSPTVRTPRADSAPTIRTPCADSVPTTRTPCHSRRKRRHFGRTRKRVYARNGAHAHFSRHPTIGGSITFTDLSIDTKFAHLFSRDILPLRQYRYV